MRGDFALLQITLKAVAAEVSRLVLDTRELSIEEVTVADGSQPLQHQLGESSEVKSCSMLQIVSSAHADSAVTCSFRYCRRFIALWAPGWRTANLTPTADGHMLALRLCRRSAQS